MVCVIKSGFWFDKSQYKCLKGKFISKNTFCLIPVLYGSIQLNGVPIETLYILTNFGAPWKINDIMGPPYFFICLRTPLWNSKYVIKNICHAIRFFTMSSSMKIKFWENPSQAWPPRPLQEEPAPWDQDNISLFTEVGNVSLFRKSYHFEEYNILSWCYNQLEHSTMLAVCCGAWNGH